MPISLSNSKEESRSYKFDGDNFAEKNLLEQGLTLLSLVNNI